MVDLIYHQLRLQILNLLLKARDVELVLLESSLRQDEVMHQGSRSTAIKAIAKCAFCRKKGHSVDQYFRKTEVANKSKGSEESKLSCYGCGAAGYYETNRPTCNVKAKGNPIKCERQKQC